ncbi:MAG: hemerythrin domain-containing protein [Planctomycetota bacterium]
MGFTESLREEHKEIKLMLEILGAICRKLENKEDIPDEHLEKIMEFIKVFVDRCHHGKEEDILFPAMIESGLPKESGPISIMLIEHTTGRNYVKEMNRAIKSKDFNKFTENAYNYSHLLQQHIFKEDNILYMIAENQIPANKQKEIVEQFEKVEKEIIGPGKHQEFHELIHHLEKVYIKHTDIG